MDRGMVLCLFCGSSGFLFGALGAGDQTTRQKLQDPLSLRCDPPSQILGWLGAWVCEWVLKVWELSTVKIAVQTLKTL